MPRASRSFPGLVRYDEAWNPAVTDIGHAFRVTVRATNGYVYPASHRAGSTAGALPMGARLRLKTSVGGQDPALRTSDPNVRKIFRAMQKYGLIVADNGSDMYITGTFDTRWNNDILNPAFATLERQRLRGRRAGLEAGRRRGARTLVSASPTTVVGGNPATGTVTLTAAAPAGGALVALASASGASRFRAPSTWPRPAQRRELRHRDRPFAADRDTLSATLRRRDEDTRSPSRRPRAAPLAGLTLSPTSVAGGTSFDRP